MSREKSYAPVASYEQIKQAEAAINSAATVADSREVTRQHGAKVGYKAFCYLLTGKLTPEGIKPDEAAATAVALEESGKRVRRKPSITAFWPNIPTTRWQNGPRH
jgi:hypothetical protein